MAAAMTLLAGAALSLAACGGSGSDDEGDGGWSAEQQAVIATIDGFYGAVAEDQDAQAACEYLLPPSARKQVPVSECAADLRREDEFREGVEDEGVPEVLSVEVDGDRAKVTFAGQEKPVRLLEEDGRWYLAALLHGR